MLLKPLTMMGLAAVLAFSPATRAAADAGDFVAGAVIGGIVGHAVTKESQRKKAQQSSAARSSIPSTQEGREIQASLNYFGFNAGSVDGQLGRRSRDAIARYQVYMGYPATGQLTLIEQDILVTSYKRAQVGGYDVTQQMASHPDGARGLMKIYRTELAGQSQQAPVQSASATTAQSALPSFGTSASGSALPNFQAMPTQASLAAHCNSVSLVTNTNGGYATLANMTDPDLVLNEQFCLARTYAIENGERLAAQVQGLTPSQIAQQCDAVGPAMETYIVGLSRKGVGENVLDVQGFLPATGMSNDQIAGTAEICLGVGYRTDDMQVALGSAMLLVAVGQTAYAELVGHHLMRGFGVAPRPDLSKGWFNEGFGALNAGVIPVFNPGEPGRTELLQQAVAQMN